LVDRRPGHCLNFSARYAVTDFREDEVLRVKKAFDEVLKHV
jgi:hypothetical protein